MNPQLAAIIARTWRDLLHAANYPQTVDDIARNDAAYREYTDHVWDTYHIHPVVLWRAARANGDL